MARRATILHALRGEGNFPVLYIVGADEFTADVPDSGLEKTDIASPELVQHIYSALRPDVGYLSPAASSWFGSFVPESFLRIEKSPITKRIEIGGLVIALIFFPDIHQNERNADEVLSAVLAAAHEVADVDLRIGISPWGFQREYAAREGLAQAFHIVLGAGEGAHFPLDATAMEPALWVRAAEDGRSVVSIDLEACPPRDMPPAWIQGINIRAREIRLGDEIPEDRHVKALLESR